jgi:hypothetical protein
MTETTRQPQLLFSLRTLLAVVAGCSFVAFAAQWLLALGAGPRTPIIIVPWALGSFAGIYFSARSNRSTLLGAICGGALATMIFPGTLVMYLYLNGLNGVRSLSGLWMQLELAVCGSALLATIIAIPREGLRLRRQPDCMEPQKFKQHSH